MMGFLAGKKISFYDAKAQHIRIGEVRLHQGRKLLVLTNKNEWREISMDDVRKVYDGGNR